MHRKMFLPRLRDAHDLLWMPFSPGEAGREWIDEGHGCQSRRYAATPALDFPRRAVVNHERQRSRGIGCDLPSKLVDSHLADEAPCHGPCRRSA